VSRPASAASSSSNDNSSGSSRSQSKRHLETKTADVKDVNGEEMGMTQERQREIQASLFKMLGQPDATDEEKTDGSKVAGDSESSSSSL
jgi:hypothetical protein